MIQLFRGQSPWSGMVAMKAMKYTSDGSGPYPEPYPETGMGEPPGAAFKGSEPPMGEPEEPGRGQSPVSVELPERWRDVLGRLEYAFQPIVNSLTGITFGVEALMRGCERAGFGRPSAIMDEAFADGVLYAVDLELRRMAVGAFARIPFHRKIKLFFNYDPRVHLMSDYAFGRTEGILRAEGLRSDAMIFELSERHRIASNGRFRDVLCRVRKRGFKIALDDFGAGFASYELFYHSDPDFLKFDRFLIADVDSDVKKRTFCTHIINLARLMGVVVIAEGIETEREFLACKDLGFELMQGYFIQRPTTETARIGSMSRRIADYAERNRRARRSDAELLTREITVIDTISAEDDVKILFTKFTRNSRSSFFPVLDSGGFPLGIVHERSIKKYVYSPYGYDLLCNKSIAGSLSRFVEKCPIVDINTPQEKILEVFVNNPDSEGVIITRDLHYAGFLTARSLLAVLNERKLAVARETNPLTGLPGNILINRYIADALAGDGAVSFIYFDFNNFKPFNDRFGFRQGDRAILLFAEALSREFGRDGCFAGHIGGDDFFAGVRHERDDDSRMEERVEALIDGFNDGVRAFYNRGEARRGVYRALDRDGVEREFPLLSVSAALITMAAGVRPDAHVDISARLSELKAAAKRSGKKLVPLRIGGGE